MQAGVYWSVLGGIEALVRKLAERSATPPDVFFTGGDAAVLAAGSNVAPFVWPEMTLEGVRLSAESLPG
jgi:type III pantothenate kinase